jgi:hypothetical protein
MPFFAGRQTPSKYAVRAERGIEDDTTVVKRQLQKLIDLIMPKGNTVIPRLTSDTANEFFG